MIAIIKLDKAGRMYVPNHTIKYSYNASINKVLKELDRNQKSLVKTLDHNHYLVVDRNNLILILTEDSPWYSFFSVKWNKKQKASFQNLINELIKSEDYNPNYVYEL